MRFRVVCDIDVSQTLADTIKRTGLVLSPDGSGLKVQIPNSPTIPKRKTNVVFIENPKLPFGDVAEST